jgi:ADP-ribose pyrophosphatase YjhB (NUDIX family)
MDTYLLTNCEIINDPQRLRSVQKQICGFQNLDRFDDNRYHEAMKRSSFNDGGIPKWSIAKGQKDFFEVLRATPLREGFEETSKRDLFHIEEEPFLDDEEKTPRGVNIKKKTLSLLVRLCEDSESWELPDNVEISVCRFFNRDELAALIEEKGRTNEITELCVKRLLSTNEYI